MPLPTDYVRDSIGQQAKSTRAFLKEGAAPGAYEVDTDERGKVEFSGRVFARDNNDKVIEIKNLKDLPVGAEIMLTDPTGSPVSYGTKIMDGDVELYGDKPTIGDDVSSYISRMASEIPRSVAASGGLAAEAAGAEGAADAMLGFAEKSGDSIDLAQYRGNPAGAMADQTGSRSPGRNMLNLAAGSTPFLATFGAATKLGQAVGMAMGAPFYRKRGKEIVRHFGNVGGMLAAMKTNAFLNAGFVANDIQQAMEEMGVPPEQQREAMRDGAIIPGVVSALTAVAAAGNFLGRGGIQKQSFIEGGTELIEELTQAEMLEQYGHQPYNFTDTALQSFGAGYLSQMGIGALGNSLRHIAKYPELMELRQAMAKTQNLAKSLGGLNLAENYQVDKEFFKTLTELNKWSARRGEVERFSHQELRSNFGRFFPGFEGQEEKIRAAVLQATQAFNEAVDSMKKPIEGMGNAAKILKLAQSGDLGSDEAREFLETAATTMGMPAEAPMEDKADLASNFMTNVDSVWRDWRITEAYRNAYGDLLPRRPGNIEDAKALIKEADIESVLERAPQLKVEIERMRKQNIMDEVKANAFNKMLDSKPLFALVAAGLIDDNKAATKVMQEPKFAQKVAESENNQKVVQAYQRLEQPARVRPQTLKLNLSRAAKQDEKETASQQKANEGAEKPKPVEPSTSAREKAYADALKEFVKDIEDRRKAGEEIARWMNALFAKGVLQEQQANLRFHDNGDGKVDPEGMAEVMSILAQGISEGLIDIPYGVLPDAVEDIIFAMVDKINEAKAAAAAPPKEETPPPPPPPAAPTAPPPPTPEPPQGGSEGTGEDKPVEKPEDKPEDKPVEKPEEGGDKPQEEGGEESGEDGGEVKETGDEPKGEVISEEEKRKMGVAADAAIHALYTDRKVEEEQGEYLKKAMSGIPMTDNEGKRTANVTPAALWLAYLSGGAEVGATDGDENFNKFVDTIRSKENISLGVPGNFNHKQLLDQMAAGGLLDKFEDEGETFYAYPLNEAGKGIDRERGEKWNEIRNKFFAEKRDDEDGEPPQDGERGGAGDSVMDKVAKWWTSQPFKRMAAKFDGGRGLAPSPSNAAEPPTKVRCV